MKTTLKLLALGVTFAAASLQAQVDLYVTGSTAFRANAYRSIRALYGANLASQNPADPASSQNQVTWSGTIPSLFGGQTVTIHASYSGSVAGIQALVQNTSQNYLQSSTPGVATIVSHQADLAFSDVFQTSTIYQSTALDDAQVGVLPFAWVKSTSGASAVTNVTIQQLQPSLSNGRVKLSYFTGNTNDTGYMYLVDRDSGSGTRMTAEKDALFAATPILWAPDGSCNWTNNNPGFSSGSGVVSVLNSCGPALGYLGLSDANNVASGANILSYDGVLPFNGTLASPDFTPVRTGLYSFWCYEHLFARTTASATVTTFRTGLAAEIDNDLATSTSAIQLSTMKVSREADGGPVSP
jgi:ABC-type phosphate transport system substrate-binding protein